MDGSFRRVALQFPDSLLREAPEVLWTLQARVRKLTAGAGDGSAEEGSVGAAVAVAVAPPLIFVTGDTSYGSCCVDEVSAQHLQADAIVHYGEKKFDCRLFFLGRSSCCSNMKRWTSPA